VQNTGTAQVVSGVGGFYYAAPVTQPRRAGIFNEII
jgi:hypothetical protein